MVGKQRIKKLKETLKCEIPIRFTKRTVQKWYDDTDDEQE